MPILFFPNQEDLESCSVSEKIELLLEGAERYKAFVLGTPPEKLVNETGEKKLNTPRNLVAAYNWDEIAKLLRQLREMPENSATNKLSKAEYLNKLAEVYEVLRGAKLPKLEAVRMALINEVNQLKSSARQMG